MIDNIQELIPINSPSELRTYQQILNNTALIVMVDKEGVILHVNRKFCDISGYARHELVGKPMDVIRSGQPDEDNFRAMWEKLSAGEVWKGEFLNRKKDGDLFWEEATIYPFKKDDGTTYQYISIGSDITTFKNAIQIKDQFMANISHELRTPLHSIHSLSNLLAESSMNDEQSDFVENIRNATGILMRMVEDMLDLNKIESGHIRFENQIFSPHVLVHSLARMFTDRTREKKLDFTLDYDPNLPEYVLGDAFRLKQVLIHLLENAVKYTRQGHIRLQCRLRKSAKGEHWFEFRVEDSGIGIARESLSLIQEKFQQARMENTRTYGGPGIGLSIVRQLIALQKGSFTIDSDQNSGTRVTITIPFREASEQKEHKSLKDAPSSISGFPNMKVLIAEDVDINQLVIKKHMQKFGFTFDFADNGKIALEKLRNSHYDIVLMDMQMPVMDGYDAIRTIRKEFPEPQCHIPIISITASVMGEAPRKCLEAGANDYVPKPYNVAELKTKMEKWVAKNTYQQKNKNSENMHEQNSTNANALIDLGYLDQLSEGDDDFSISMLSYFLDNTPGVIQEMKQFYGESDWKALRNVAHKFKPQLTFMGIKSIFNDVENIEQYANKVENTDQIPALIDRVANVCVQAMEEIKVELEKLLDKG